MVTAMFPRDANGYPMMPVPAPGRGSIFKPPAKDAISQTGYRVPVPKMSSSSSHASSSLFRPPRPSTSFMPRSTTPPVSSSGFASCLLPSVAPSGSIGKPSLVRMLGPLPRGDGSVEVSADGAASDQPKRGSSTFNPPIYNKVRGSKRMAMETARDPARREAALAAYRRDQRSINDTSCFNLATWQEFHAAWY